MTLLSLVRAFCFRTGISPSLVVATALDQQTMQVSDLLNEVIEDLMDHNWTGMVQEALWSATAAENQGPLTTLAPNGFKWILPETLFDRTMRLPLFGPLSASDWQALKALPNSGPFYKYRIVGGNFLLNPEPPAGHELVFEYASSWCVLDADGVTSKPYPTADTDTFLVPDTLLQAGLRWKWKYEKGLEYAEDFSRYEMLRENSLGRDGTKKILNMGDAPSAIQPGIFVPSGNWNIQ